jgi:hypothetical protein
MVWGTFIQMKAEEQKKNKARWNKSNQLEERKLERGTQAALGARAENHVL